MEDGTERYFKAFATGENKGGKFEIKYTQDGSTEMRKISTIDDRSETMISQEIYNETKSAYPPKKTPVGEDHQVGELPPVGSNMNYERAKSMTPLTRRQILIDKVTPLTNEEVVEDMKRAGKSQEGYGRKTRRRRKKNRRKSRKKRKTKCSKISNILNCQLTFEFNARDALTSSPLLSSTSTRRTTLSRVGGAALSLSFFFFFRFLGSAE